VPEGTCNVSHTSPVFVCLQDGDPNDAIQSTTGSKQTVGYLPAYSLFLSSANFSIAAVAIKLVAVSMEMVR
jgi:hypothetical protein